MYQPTVWHEDFDRMVTLNFAPGESVEWLDESSFSRIVATPPIKASDAPDNYEVQDVVDGLMTARITQHPQTLEGTQDGCYNVGFESPYVINEASPLLCRNLGAMGQRYPSVLWMIRSGWRYPLRC